MGELLRFVVAHEVGHTLGLQHNMKASSMYPFEKVRDAKWLKEYGHTPTIMDYSRFNYVAQPEDNIPVDLLIPKIGPTTSGPRCGATSRLTDARRPKTRRRLSTSGRASRTRRRGIDSRPPGRAGADPGELTEAVGDADAVKASTLGLKNLKRVADMLLAATSTEKGEPYNDLEEVYNAMIGQWRLEMGHVTAIVGGFNSQQKHVGQDGALYAQPPGAAGGGLPFLDPAPVPPPAALLVRPVRRAGSSRPARSIASGPRSSACWGRCSSARVLRLVEREAIDGAGAHGPADFLAGTSAAAVGPSWAAPCR